MRGGESLQRYAKLTPCLGLAVLLYWAWFCFLGGMDNSPGKIPQITTVITTPNPQGNFPNSTTKNKKLTILVKGNNSKTSRISHTEQSLLEEFADQLGVKINLLPVTDPETLDESLSRYDSDLIITDPKNLLNIVSDQIKYTYPWGISRQQVVARTDTNRIHDIMDLATRQVALKKSSPVWPLLQEMANNNRGMDLIAVPEYIKDEKILQRVTAGRYDIAIMDSISLKSILPKFLGLEVAFNLSKDKVMAWGVKSQSDELHASLNRFLYKKHLQLNVAKFYREDLPQLQQRKILRLITYPSPVNYFLDDGRLNGFEYELARRFAKNNNMRLDVVIAKSHYEMATMLLEGQGDLIAASLPTNSFREFTSLAYTQPYSYASPVVIGRPLDYPLYDIRDLAGRRIVLPAESPYISFLERIKQMGILFEIVSEKHANMDMILNGIAQGKYDLTVIGNHQIKAELIHHLDLKAHFTLQDPLPHSWVVRDTDMQLKSALNKFIKKKFRKSFYNVLYAKYLENPSLQKDGSQQLAHYDSLSPYDDIVRKYAERYGFDWRLIVAQMYQESRFDPYAVSYAGAEGLMQLLPDTAELYGITKLSDPDTSIYGGTRHLAYLRDRFEDDLLMEDRTWFTLAAYNAGYNRVKKARRLAEKMSLDKNRWFDNVEKAMLILARPYRKDGAIVQYCRCGQTIHYVREIKTLYNNYVRLTDSIRLASTNPLPNEEI